MRRSIRLPLALAALSALFPSAVNSQSPRAQPSPGGVFPAGVEQVTVDVLVLDARGAPVEGLRPEDFTVKEAGRPQTITSFEAVSVATPPSPNARHMTVSTNQSGPGLGRSFVIVFDEMNLTPSRLDAARRAVDQFLETGLRPGDVVTIVPTGGSTWWTDRMPDGRATLEAFIGHLESGYRPDTSSARISDYEALQIHYGRERLVMSQILRRYYVNGLIQECQDPLSAVELGISAGVQVVRMHAAAAYEAYRVRVDRTLGVLARVAEALGQAKGRKTILLVSEGFAHDPGQEGFRKVVAAARQANAAFYFVDASGLLGAAAAPGAPGAGAEDGRAVSDQDTLSTVVGPRQETAGAELLALDTGGSSIRNTNNLAGGMRAVSDESRAYYLLGYAPADTRRDGKFRKIEVEVARPGVKVRARRGYYAPSDKAKALPQRDDLDPRLRAAVDAPIDAAGIPLRLTAHGLGPTATGKSAALVVAEVDLGGLDLIEKAGEKTGVLETYTVVSSLRTGASVAQEKTLELALPGEAYAEFRSTGLPVLGELQLAPGNYQVRLLVRDPQSRRIGTVRHRFTVPDPGQLGTSTPILSDRLQPDAPGGPRPVPVAHRTFKAGRRLYYAYEVYGAAHDPAGAPHLTSSYMVKRADGAVLTRMEPRPLQLSPQGQVSQMLSLSLAGAQPGDYELVLTVRDDLAGRSVEVSEVFTVEG